MRLKVGSELNLPNACRVSESIRSRTVWAANALFIVAGCLSSGDGQQDAEQDLAALCRVEVLTQGLYGGEALPHTITLTDASRLSLVTVQPNHSIDNEGLCTGTLVADGWGRWLIADR